MSRLAMTLSSPTAIKIGDIVRISSDPDHVRHIWQGVLAEVIDFDSAEDENDSLVLRSACGVKTLQGVDHVHKLDVIERLAWVGWKARVEEFRQGIRQFKLDRNRENEWVTVGEVVRVADEDYDAATAEWLSTDRRRRAPLDAEDIDYWGAETWLKRRNWQTAKVLETPAKEGGDFLAEVLTDDSAYLPYGDEIGDMIKVYWNAVWRIEPTPEEGE